MDNSQNSTPPRKKQKLDDQIMEANNENTNVPGHQEMPIVERDQASREVQVGVLEYVSPDSLCFSGIFKKRYADFIVNEILPSGDVVHLTTLHPSKSNVSPNKGPNDNPPATDDLKFTKDKPYPAANGEHTEKEKDIKPVDGGEETETPDGLKSSNDAIYAGSEPHQAPNEEHTEKEKDSKSTNDGQGGEVPDNLNVDRKETSDPSHPETAALAKWEESRDKTEVQVSIGDQADLQRFFDESTVAEMTHLFNKVINSPHRSIDQYGMVHSNPVTNRELRKEAHEVIKRVFRFRLDSSTDNKGVITIAAAGAKDTGNDGHYSGRQSGRGGGGGRGRGGRNNRGRQQDFSAKKSQKELFQDLGGDYLHFTLYKENKDTLEVISFIARQLKIRPNMFQFAGNKDRRAVTAQRASAYRIFPNKLSNLNRTLRNAKVGDFEFRKDKLVLGELQGNAFCITLRDCEFEGSETMDEETRKDKISETVRLGLENLCGKGFINYYGLQRFGSFATRTDEIGVKLLQGDLKGAVDAILLFSPAALAAAMDPSPNDNISRDDKDRAEAISMFRKTGASRPALNILPRKFSAESNLIHWLGEENRSTDYKTALESMPRNLRMMYVHAYQSLIWNLAASYRWKTLGAQVLAGDLVLVREHKRKEQDQNHGVEVDVEGEVVIRPGEEDCAVTADDRFERARTLSAEEAASGQYTIYDIVLPLPGFDILYPEHMLSFYKDTMGKEQYGNLDPLDMTRSWKDISLSGSYRKLLAKPLPGYSWSVHIYEGENEHLVSTDLEILEAQKNAARKQNQKNKEPDTKPVDESVPTDAAEEAEEAAGVQEDVNKTDTPQAQDQSAQTVKQEVTALEILQLQGHPAEAQAGPQAGPQAADPTNDPNEQVAAPEAKPRKRIGVVLEFKLGTAQYATMALRELMKHGGAREHKPDFSAGRGMD